MTPARLREIVTALRSPDGWGGNIAEMNEAALMLADLAGIDRPDADLDAIEARANAATWGPWRYTESSAPWWRTRIVTSRHSIECCTEEDATFITAARTDVPALVARVRRTEAKLARAEDTLADLRADEAPLGGTMTARRRLLPQLDGTRVPALGDLGPLEPIALSFTVPGPPVPKARPRVVHRTGQRPVAFTPRTTKRYTEHVGLLASGAVHRYWMATGQRWPLDAAEYALTVDIYTSAGRGTRGDADNHLKLASDAGNGVLWADDRDVVDAHVRIHPCEAGRERAEVCVEVLRR